MLPDENSAAASTAWQALTTNGAVVPAHWLVEILSGLLAAERRERISSSDTVTAVSAICRLPIDVASVSIVLDAQPVFGRAKTLGLSVYDAAYIDLALSRGLPLATLDKQLERAALSVGLKVLAEAA